MIGKGNISKGTLKGESTHFTYGKVEMDYLSARDINLAKVIKYCGWVARPIHSNIFQSLVQSIVSQQISSQAAGTVYSRLEKLVPTVNPENIFAISEMEIQKCGMTTRKANYVKSLAGTVMQGKMDLYKLTKMDDEAVIKTLMSLPGIGRWTAEMTLLHALERPNIFSYDDLVIRRSLKKLHQLPKINRKIFSKFFRLYSPYCSVAMIYLWRYGKSNYTLPN